jgi:hypothetical protein
VCVLYVILHCNILAAYSAEGIVASRLAGVQALLLSDAPLKMANWEVAESTPHEFIATALQKVCMCLVCCSLFNHVSRCGIATM